MYWFNSSNYLLNFIKFKFSKRQGAMLVNSLEQPRLRTKKATGGCKLSEIKVQKIEICQDI